MTPTVIITVLLSLSAMAIGISIALWVSRVKLARRVRRLNDEMLEASRDASVGHRLSVPNDPNTAQLAHTVNRLFDALGERDDFVFDPRVDESEDAGVGGNLGRRDRAQEAVKGGEQQSLDEAFFSFGPEREHDLVA